MAKTPLSTLAQFAPCTINIRGKVAFSRVTGKIDGQELLEQQNREKGRAGRIIHTKPYMYITLNNPVIVDNGKLPPQVKQVIQERFFQRQDGTLAYTQESKSPFLPAVLYSAEVGELSGQGIASSEVPLQAELAPGLDVTIGADLFAMKSYGTVGLGLKYILLNEPVQYYSKNSISGDLDALGINYVPVSASEAPQQPTYQAPVYATPAPVQPQVVPTPMPTQAPVYAQPVQPAQPAPQQFQPQAQPPVYDTNPWTDYDIPFNTASAPQASGAEAPARPVRYY